MHHTPSSNSHPLDSNLTCDVLRYAQTALLVHLFLHQWADIQVSLYHHLSTCLTFVLAYYSKWQMCSLEHVWRFTMHSFHNLYFCSFLGRYFRVTLWTFDLDPETQDDLCCSDGVSPAHLVFISDMYLRSTTPCPGWPLTPWRMIVSPVCRYISTCWCSCTTLWMPSFETSCWYIILTVCAWSSVINSAI